MTTISDQISRNWLTMAAAVLSAGIAWGATQGQLAALEQTDIALQAQRDEDMGVTLRFRADAEARLRVAEAAASAALLENRGIREDISELKQAQAEIIRLLRDLSNDRGQP